MTKTRQQSELDTNNDEQPVIESVEKEDGVVNEDTDMIEPHSVEIHRFVTSILAYVVPIVKPVAKYTYNVSAIYLFWIIIHYLAAHAYVKYCVPTEIFGFIMSPFLISAPHCKAMRWVIHNGGNTIDNMWVIFGTWVCSHLIITHVKT